MASEAQTMDSTEAGGVLQKIVLTGGLGKSTLVGNIQVSIPMPSGATPPPVPSSQENAPAGGQGTKTGN